MKGSADTLIITCEHGGNRIPSGWRHLFRGSGKLLSSHRGWDPGSLTLARFLSRELKAPLHGATVSRLLVDLNRSPHHRNLFSQIIRNCTDAEREHLLARYYTPYRTQVAQIVARCAQSGKPVLHLSVHSFAPTLDRHRRNADIGLLYDPGRPREAHLAQRLRAALCTEDPGLRVRCNYPYRGTADGFTTWLRRRHTPSLYAGIELEMNQALVARPAEKWTALRRCVGNALRAAMASR